MVTNRKLHSPLTMLSQVIVAITLVAVAATLRLPESHHLDRPDSTKSSLSNIPGVVVSTVFGTATLTLPVTVSATVTPSATSAPSDNIYTATQLYAYRENSPIHLLPIQARGLYFQLGGLPATACPEFVQNCPPGVLTGINQCQLVSIVP